MNGPRHHQARCLGHAPPRRAVTLAELLAVVTLLAALGLVVVPVAFSGADLRVDKAAARIRQDIAYARSRSIIERKPYCLVFDVAQGFYYLAAAQNSAMPIVEPITKYDYRVFFKKASGLAALADTSRVVSFAEVDLVQADFDGSQTLLFDCLGMPVTAGGAPLTGGTIDIASAGASQTITIAAPPLDGTSPEPSESSSGGGLFGGLFGGLLGGFLGS